MPVTATVTTPAPVAGPPPEVPGSELREATLEGVRWVGFARIGAEVIALASAVLLARLVSPAQFGLLAVSIIVRELALMIANETIGSPLVQRREVTRAHLEVAVFMALILGVTLTLATLVAAPLVVEPLFGPAEANLFRLFGPAFAFAGVMIVPLAILQRALDFRRQSIVELISVVVTSFVAVALAFAGLGAKAYVIGAVLGIAVAAVAYTAMTRPPRPRWHGREARELLSFGVPAAAAGLAGVGYRNADYLVLGARVSPLQVGYYYRAFTLGVEYENKISGIVSRVSFPVYARTAGLDQMRAIRERVVRANAVLIWPLLAGFVVLAPVLIPWVFGARWEPAVAPAQVLAVAGMAGTVRAGTSPLLLAAGHPRALLRISVAEVVCYAAAVFAASSHGILTVAIVVSVFQVLALVLVYLLVLGPQLGVGVRALARDLAPAGISCLALAGVGAALAALCDPLPVLPFLLVTGTGATLAYGIALRTLFPAAWADVRMLADRIRRR